METPLILERLYRLPAHRKPRRRIIKALKRGLTRWVQRHTSRLTVGSLVFGALIVSHVYYYNKLITLQYDVETARAQIEVAQQKRNHVRRDLTHLVDYYAHYEKNVLKDVTAIRAEHEKKAPPATPKALLAQLDAVAEQYPSLDLEKSVHMFSDISTQIENEVAKRTETYNNAVNNYTTVLHSFPGDVFGGMLGFHDVPFYRPEKSETAYHEVKP